MDDLTGACQRKLQVVGDVNMLVMRKRFRVLLLAALVAAFVVPVGFALSLESASGWRSPRPAAFMTSPSASIVSSIVVSRPTVTVAARSFPLVIHDAAKLLIVGSVLIGLAAALRRDS